MKAMTFGSLFTGVRGMDQGAEAAGMQCRWMCEWDQAAAGVNAFHRPDVPQYVDVRNFKPNLKDHAVDAIFGGSPCQDLSVAGKRAGLDGGRSGLFYEMVRVCKRLRPRFIVWENVPGAFSSNDGRDFACVLRAWTGLAVEVPADGWGNAGFVRTPFPEMRWNVAWRVLDSQYCGVPQRRRRIFLVGSLGDASCAEILFEPESVCGNPAPSREAGEEVAGVLTSRSSGGGGGPGAGTDEACAGYLQVSGCLQANGKAAGSATQQDAESGMLIPQVAGTICKDSFTGGASGRPEGAASGHFLPVCMNTGQAGAEIGIGTTLNCNHEAPIVAHSLRAEGFDASEDGTGRGTPLVPVAFNYKMGAKARGVGYAEDQIPTLGTQSYEAVAFAIQERAVSENLENGPQGKGYQEGVSYTLEARHHVQAVAFSCKDHGSDVGEVSPTLRGMGHSGSHANAGGQVAVAFDLRGRENGSQFEGPHDTANIRSASGGSSRSYAATHYGVRRLTPRECERLQGWPDDHTRFKRAVRFEGNRWIPCAETKEQADGPRYKQCGNGVTAPVARWIAARILSVGGKQP